MRLRGQRWTCVAQRLQRARDQPESLRLIPHFDGPAAHSRVTDADGLANVKGPIYPPGMSATIDEPTQVVPERPQGQQMEDAAKAAASAEAGDAEAPQCPPGEMPVRDAAARLLIRLSDGWGPEEITQPLLVKQLVWGEHDFSRVARELTVVDGPWLHVLCGGDGYTQGDPDLARISSKTLQNKSITGTLECGYQFSAEFATLKDRQMIFTVGQTPHYSTIIAGMQWILQKEDPVFWIGKLEGPTHEALPGNLAIYAKNGTYTNFRLQGVYTYYLIQHKENWRLVIDNPDKKKLDKEGLAADFLALEFVFGRQLKLHRLDGINEQGELVARSGGFYGVENPSNHSEWPVPILQNQEVLLFEAISKALREQPDVHLKIPLVTYLDALTGHLDIDYMRLQIALEAFAFWVLKSKGDAKERLVEDPKEWEKWVKAHKTDIYKHARKGIDDATSKKLANDFYIKVKTAGKHASGVRTAEAFALFGLETTKAMDDEISLRNPVVHKMMMVDGEYDIHRESDRIGMVRALLVALVAKVVGYQGDIGGSKYLDGGKWWKAGSKRVPFYRAGEPPVFEEGEPLDPNDPMVKALLTEVGRNERLVVKVPTAQEER